MGNELEKNKKKERKMISMDINMEADKHGSTGVVSHPPNFKPSTARDRRQISINALSHTYQERMARVRPSREVPHASLYIRQESARCGGT